MYGVFQQESFIKAIFQHEIRKCKKTALMYESGAEKRLCVRVRCGKAPLCTSVCFMVISSMHHRHCLAIAILGEFAF